MASVNKVILIGRLGKDPEVRTINGNTVKTVVSFPLATTETYKNKQNERVEQTEWHNIVVWGGLASVAEKYLSKGSLIYLEGKIQTQKWEDKEGNKKSKVNIFAETFTMLNNKERQDAENTEETSENKKNTSTPPIENTDDLPF